VLVRRPNVPAAEIEYGCPDDPISCRVVEHNAARVDIDDVVALNQDGHRDFEGRGGV